MKKLKILLVSSEVVPFAKTGGLADVAGALPIAISDLEHDIRVVMPKYQQIDEKFTSKMENLAEYNVFLDWRNQTTLLKKYSLLTDKNKEVPFYFVENDYYFNRPNLYSYNDDDERFAFFCKAVLEMLPKIDFKPDIIHCNDWQTGPICALLKENYREIDFYKNIKTVYSIHNLRYQGNFSAENLKLLGLDYSCYTPDKLEFYGNISYMKAGINYADVLTTVSENYAKEIQMPEYGEGLDGIIRKKNNDLYGIVNGVDYKVYNPETDNRIYRNYSDKNIQNKLENKRYLQQIMNLPMKDVPLIGMVSRLVDQKGLDLIIERIDELMKLDIQLVIQGIGDPTYENMLRKIERKYKDKFRVRVTFNTDLVSIGLPIGSHSECAKITFSTDMPQKIYGGADMFLMPSRFEPCGLSQLYSFRYGTIPIVRATGGLIDTVQEFNIDTMEGSGFTFADYDSKEMVSAVQKAVNTYFRYPKEWQKLVKKVMTLDFSWQKSAKKYLELYKQITKSI